MQLTTARYRNQLLEDSFSKRFELIRIFLFHVGQLFCLQETTFHTSLKKTKASQLSGSICRQILHNTVTTTYFYVLEQLIVKSVR